MSQKGHTKDEKFMLALYEMALEAGEIDTAFNRYQIGEKIGLHPKAVDTICTLLLQANFIKKEGKEAVFLTDNGQHLVEKVISEK